MSRKTLAVLSFVLGAIVGPFLLGALNALWNWSQAQGPQLVENAVGVFIFLFVLVLFAVLLLVAWKVFQVIRRKRASNTDNSEQAPPRRIQKAADKEAEKLKSA